MKTFTKILQSLGIIGATILLTAGVVEASQITVPSAPTSGYSVVSTTTGNYIATQNNTANGLVQLSATTSIININNVQSVTGTITSGKTLNALGDSITAGFGIASSSMYINLMGGYENWAVTDLAVDGETAADQADNIYSITVSTSTNATYMIGANDARQSNFQTNSGLQDFQNIDLAELAWLAIPSDKKFIGTDTTNITYGGTWITSPNFAIGRQSTTNASTASTTVYGSSVIIGAEAYGSLAGKGGTYTVEIDGTTYGPYSDQFNTNISSINLARNYAPTALIFPNLPLQNHSVLVTVTSGTSASNPVAIDWISGVNGSQFTAGPEVYEAGVLRLSAAGYAAWGTTPATGTNFNTVLKNNASYLASLGLNVSFVDVSAYLNQTTDLQGDGLHPNAQGNVKLAQAFEAATNGFEYSHDRQASQYANIVTANPNTYSIGAQTSNSGLYTAGLTVTNNGSSVVNVGIGTTTPHDALTLQYAATGGQYGLTLANTDRTNYDLIRLLGTGSQYWTYGMGNDLEGTFGVANKFFVFDGISNAFPLVIANSTDNTGIGGTTTPAMKLSVNGTSLFHGALTQDVVATSTFSDGINITNGCYAFQGSCISGGGGGSGTVNSGSANQAAYYATGGTAVSGSPSIYISGGLGIGTTTPSSSISNGGYFISASSTDKTNGLSNSPAQLYIGTDPVVDNLYGQTVITERDISSAGTYFKTFDGGQVILEPLFGKGFLGNGGSLSFVSRNTASEFDIFHATSTNQLQFSGGNSVAFVGVMKVGIGTTTPGSTLSVGNTNGINFTTATSTFSSTGGINLSAGCFAIGGACIGSGGGGSGTVGSGNAGQYPYYAANGTTLTATSSIFIPSSGLIANGEGIMATSSSMNIDWATTTNQLLQYGSGNITATMIHGTPGQHLTLVTCNPNGTGGAITFAGNVSFAGGVQPGNSTQANTCDVWSWLISNATGTPKYLLIGMSSGFQ